MANEVRLIDANAFKVFLEDVRQQYLEEDALDSDFAAQVIETVQDNYLDLAPTVDAVEVVHGRWVNSRHRRGFYMCSVCESNDRECQCFYSNTWKYCPNCGAKMDGDGNG